MTPMSARLDDLRQRLTALRTRFAEVAARAAAAAAAMRASAVPAAALLDDLRGTAADFDELRLAILDEARTLPSAPDPARLGTLKALDALVTTIDGAEADRARRAAWEAARDDALSALDRVMTLVHREDTNFPPLAECQAKARELHAALSAAQPADLERVTTMVSGGIRPFAELVALAEGWNRLDDERCALLQDSISRNFGRPLALATVRGKLGREGEIIITPEVAEVAEAPEAPIVPTARAAPVGATPAAGDVPVPGVAPVGGGMRAAAGAPGSGGGGAPTGPPVVAGDRVAPPGSPLVVEIRLTGERVQVETPQERRAREELLERMAEETAQWWVGARRGWESLAQRGLPPAEAAREALARFPYLLSVPLAKSDEFEDGRLAEGYAILLQRFEKEESGFVRAALSRLNPQFATRARDETYALGHELYLYIVAEGRLYKTYPDFLKDVLVHALPEPGVWLQGAITDAEGSTTIVTRPEQPGGRPEQSRTLTEAAERFTTHTFGVTTGPLTARVFSVQAGGLSDPTDVDIHLKENGAATDHAWVVVAPMDGTPQAPRKHRVGGTKIEQLGKQHRAVWIAAFNSDPNADKRYELTVALARKAATPLAKAAQAQAATGLGKASPFKKR